MGQGFVLCENYITIRLLWRPGGRPAPEPAPLPGGLAQPRGGVWGVRGDRGGVWGVRGVHLHSRLPCIQRSYPIICGLK